MSNLRVPGDATLLPANYKPSKVDVICSWAQQFQQHAGNKRFRAIIAQHAPLYIKAKSRNDKSDVIAAVIEKVRTAQACGEQAGVFVKKDRLSGRWYDIGSEKTRDKVGHAVRKVAEELRFAGQIGGFKKEEKWDEDPKPGKRRVIEGGNRKGCPPSCTTSTGTRRKSGANNNEGEQRNHQHQQQIPPGAVLKNNKRSANIDAVPVPSDDMGGVERSRRRRRCRYGVEDHKIEQEEAAPRAGYTSNAQQHQLALQLLLQRQEHEQQTPRHQHHQDLLPTANPVAGNEAYVHQLRRLLLQQQRQEQEQQNRQQLLTTSGTILQYHTESQHQQQLNLGEIGRLVLDPDHHHRHVVSSSIVPAGTTVEGLHPLQLLGTPPQNASGNSSNTAPIRQHDDHVVEAYNPAFMPSSLSGLRWTTRQLRQEEALRLLLGTALLRGDSSPFLNQQQL